MKGGVRLRIGNPEAFIFHMKLVPVPVPVPRQSSNRPFMQPQKHGRYLDGAGQRVLGVYDSSSGG